MASITSGELVLLLAAVLIAGALTLAVTGAIEESALGGWPAVMIGYSAAVSISIAFATMIVVSRLIRATAPGDAPQIFARMHLPERLGMGVERVPGG